MRSSLLVAFALTLTSSAAAVDRSAQAATTDLAATPPVTRAAEITLGTGGTRTWARIVELGGLANFDMTARTLFVPSDAAFDALPKDRLCDLLTPAKPEVRRAFLARAASDSRIAPETLSGRRISVATLDGRALTIDATGGELMVGEAEALDVGGMPDGRVIFILDDAMLN